MKIALLIGVSSYQREDPLPACRQDVEAIDVLLAKARFEHRLCLSGEVFSRDAKAQILSFLDAFRGQSVSQVLFYFSGHGTIQDGDLLYMLSDFDEERPRQTSIENQEVDNWIRDLAPKAAIKITDCCHSGVQYVKNGSSMHSAVAKSQGQFSSCYFLAASQSNEVTYAGDEFSDFTEQVLKGLAQQNVGPIRYKDLIDAVLDAYRDNSSQRPYSLLQGDMRDIFFEQTADTRALLEKLLEPKHVSEPSSPLEELPNRTLTELVEADTKRMLASDTAAGYLEKLRARVEGVSVDQELKELYDLAVEFSRAWEAEIPNEEMIGKWLRRNGSDLFAEPIEEEIRTKIPHHLLDPVDAYMNPFGKVQAKREITGVRVTSGLEYDFIRLSLEPKYPNLNKYEAAFLLLWSTRNAVLFRYVTPLRAINWSNHELPEQVSWNVVRFSAEDLERISESVIGTFREAENLAKDNILRRFSLKEIPKDSRRGRALPQQ